MKNISSKPVLKCQISNSRKLRSIIFLGYLPPVNTLRKLKEVSVEEKSFPAELLYCPKSKLVQLGLIVDKKILFPFEYPYTSSITKILRENFKNLYKEVTKKFVLLKEDLVIDIGSNDGNLLTNFRGKHRVLGITPEKIGKLAIKKGIPTIIDYYDKKVVKTVLKKFGKAKIITATNVFAHIDNINDVIKLILKSLKNDGIFISESHYLLPLIRSVQYDTIYHEHLRYYSLESLNFLFKKHGLEIIHVKEVPTHGGSIRVYVARKGKFKASSSVRKQFLLEKKYLNWKQFIHFRKKTVDSKLKLYKILNSIKSKNKTIYGIGAPSRASTLINYVGLDQNIIDCVLEIKGSYKINHYIPGTKIPILDEKKLFQDRPDYVILFSWHIAKELKNNLKKKGYKGKFIIPLPAPRIEN